MKLFDKTFAACLLGLSFIGIYAISITAQSSSADAVKLFNGRDGTGMTQDIPLGTYQVSGKQIASSSGNDAGISVKVPKDLFIRFCQDKGSGDGGGGKCEEYGEGTHNLKSGDFNFIKVWKQTVNPAAVVTPAIITVPPLIVYEQLNWGGRSQVFLPGMYRSFRGEFGRINDNMAMSAVVAKGFRARFCSNEGTHYRGSGDCEEHPEGRHNLRFANSISFIEVRDLSDQSPDDEKMPVILYEDASQIGKMQGFDVGEFLASRNQLAKIGNDRASSITVKDGYRALVCADEGAAEGATCEEFGAGKRNIKNKKSASYIKVWKGDK